MLITCVHRLIAAQYRLSGFRKQALQLEQAEVTLFERAGAGNKFPIVFVHGLGTSSSSWARLVPFLPRNQGAVCIDLPGFGSSRFYDARALSTLTRLDEALDELARIHFPPQFILTGHSLGGWLALRFALRHPGRLRRLILINPAGVWYPGAASQADEFSIRHRREVRHLLDTMWYRYPWYFRVFDGAVYRELRMRRVPEIVTALTVEDFVNQRLQEISLPVDIIWGMNDRLIRLEALQILEERLPSSRTFRIDRCGHIPQLERPAELAGIIRQILDPIDGLAG